MAELDTNYNSVKEEMEISSANMKTNYGTSMSQYLSVSPTFLKFPHDNNSFHIQRITIYNKTKSFIGFRIQEPRTKYFTVFYEKHGLFAGSKETIIIKCKPYDQKICFDSIKIDLTNESVETMTIPLELLPSVDWFTLPKYIVMPHVSIGQSVSKSIALPMPPQGDQPYYFFVSGANPDIFTVTPTEGRLGSQGGPEKLTLTYCPREYTSLEYTMSVHFPEIEFQPYDVIVYMKCLPGNNYSDTKLKAIESVVGKPFQKKSKPHVLKKSKPHTIKMENVEITPPPPDVFSPAGVMKFLLQRGGKSTMASEFKDSTGLTCAEANRAYKIKEKNFHDLYNKVSIHQKNMLLQHTRNFHGEDPIETNPQLLLEIRRENERVNLEYQKSLGMRDNDIEDLTRTKLKLVRQRPIRNVDYSYKSIISTPESTFHTHPNDPTGLRFAKKVILRRFIQGALVVITRRRADRRIVKLKIMIKTIKKDRQKAANELKLEEEPACQKPLEMQHLGNPPGDNTELEQVKDDMIANRKNTIMVANEPSKSLAPEIPLRAKLHSHELKSKKISKASAEAELPPY